MLKLKVENFRTLKFVELHSEKNIICIIGANDSGKSNILDALEKTNLSASIEKNDFLKTNSNLNNKIVLSIEMEMSFYHDSLLEKIKKEIEENTFISDDTKGFLKIVEENKILIKYKSLNIMQKEGKIISLIKRDSSFIGTNKWIKSFWGKIMSEWQKNKLDQYWKIEEDDNSILKAYDYPNNYFKRKMTGIKKGKGIIALIDLYINFKKMDIKKPRIKKIINSTEILKIKNFRLGLLNDSDTFTKNNDLLERSILKRWLSLLNIKSKIIKEMMSNDNHDEMRNIINIQKDKVNKKINKINKYLGESRKIELKIDFLPNNIFSIYLESKLPKNSVFSNDLSQKSDGMKRFLLLCLEIMSINKNDPWIIIIDEPEIYLNPSYQEKILEMFRHHTKNSNIQIIYSTHSPFMTQNLDFESKKILYRSAEDNSSKLINLWDSVKKNDINMIDFSSLDLTLLDGLEMLDYKILESKYSKILLVEGSTDKIIFNRIFQEMKFNDIYVVEIKGWNVENTIGKIKKKLEYFFDSHSIYSIVDFDFTGKKLFDILKNNGVNVEYLSSFSENNKEDDNYELEDFVNSKKKLSFKCAKEILLEVSNISKDKIRNFFNYE